MEDHASGQSEDGYTIDDEYPTFPPGQWVVEIQGVEPMGFEGKHLRGTEYGLFMTHAAIPHQEQRHSFVPWARVKRAYTVREP